MKKCCSCGKESEDNKKFCDNFGEQLIPNANICPSCNQENKPEAKFCIGCGFKLKKKGAKLNFNKLLGKLKYLLVLLVLILVCWGGTISIKNITKAEYKVGDEIEFGNYYQDDLNQKTPIKWIVLDVQEDKALLISKFLLDGASYNQKDVNITWERSSIRRWLNNDFFNEAFSKSEQNNIQLTDIYNQANPYTGIKGGNITKDHVFLLSLDEVDKYLPNENQRKTEVTEYAKKRNVYFDGVFSSNDYGLWWLRSPGNEQNKASLVLTDGNVAEKGYIVTVRGFSVRPVLYIKR